MPTKKFYRKKKNSRFKKRRYGKRIRSIGASIPNKMTVKLPYASQSYLNPAIGTAGVQVFRANDLYDPDFTAGGHQPRGFDQWALFYDHFTVIGAKITVRFVSMDLDYEQVAGVALMDTTTARVNVNDYLEMDRVKYATFGSRYSGDALRTMTIKCNPSRFLGVSKPLTNPNLKGTIASSPTEDVAFHVFTQCVDETQNGGYMYYVAEIEYIAVFTEPKVPNQS